MVDQQALADALKRKPDLTKELFIIEIIIYSFVKKLISICWDLAELILKTSEII
jgi:hypothetical protein